MNPSLVGRACPGPAASGDESIGSVAIWQPLWQAAQESPGLFREAPGASGWGLFLALHHCKRLAKPEGRGPQGTSQYWSILWGSVAGHGRGGREVAAINHLGFGQGL